MRTKILIIISILLLVLIGLIFVCFSNKQIIGTDNITKYDLSESNFKYYEEYSTTDGGSYITDLSVNYEDGTVEGNVKSVLNQSTLEVTFKSTNEDILITSVIDDTDSYDSSNYQEHYNFQVLKDNQYIFTYSEAVDRVNMSYNTTLTQLENINGNLNTLTNFYVYEGSLKNDSNSIIGSFETYISEDNKEIKDSYILNDNEISQISYDLKIE